MKLTPYQEKLFNHVGEVVAVYDSAHKKLWDHPIPESFVTGKHTPGLRVWISLGEDKGPYRGDYTFILTSPGDAPEGVYEKGEQTEQSKQAVDDVISCILNSICEDVTIWGQVAATEKRYMSITNKIEKAAYLGKGKVFVHFSPDCGIWMDGKEVGYDT